LFTGNVKSLSDEDIEVAFSGVPTITINEETKLEGIHKNNFFATYVIGPFLVLNPLFTLNLLRLMGEKIPSLAYEKDILEAYHIRLLKFKEIQRNEK